MLQEIRNRVDKYNLCFQEKIQGSQEFLPGGSVVKNLPAKAGDAGSISGQERLPEEGNGNPLQYSCLRVHGLRNLAVSSPWGRRRINTTQQLNNKSFSDSLPRLFPKHVDTFSIFLIVEIFSTISQKTVSLEDTKHICARQDYKILIIKQQTAEPISPIKQPLRSVCCCF